MKKREIIEKYAVIIEEFIGTPQLGEVIRLSLATAFEYGAMDSLIGKDGEE